MSDSEKFFKLISENKISEIRLLLEKNPDINFWEYSDNENNSPIHKSIFYDLPLITFLFFEELEKRGLQVNTLEQIANKKGKNGHTPLHYASYRGNLEIISKLIELNSDIYATNDQGLNVLHLASQGNQPNSIVFFMENYKLDIKIKDKSGSTPLHWACFVGAENCIDFLLNYELDINSIDNDGLTPLHLAVVSEKMRIIRKLLHKGANKNIINFDKKTPLQLALEKGKIQIVEMLSERSSKCNLCIVKPPLEKLEKNASNIYFFYFIHLFVGLIVVLEIFPSTNIFSFDQRNSFITAIYISTFFILIVTYSVLLIKDPGFRIKNKNGLKRAIDNKENVIGLCAICQERKDQSTRHCFICDSCVDEHDHHCYWINQCVGIQNYKIFFFFLTITLFNLLLNVFIALKTLIWNSNEHNSIIPNILNKLNSPTLQEVLTAIVLVISIGFFVPVLLLFIYQLSNFKGKTNSKNKFAITINSQNDENLGLISRFN